MNVLSKSEKEYWAWFTVMIITLVPVDMLSTSFAISRFDGIREANPVFNLLLQADWFLFIAVNLVVGLLAIAFFYGALEVGRETPTRLQPYYYFFIESYLGVGTGFSLLVITNNFLVIFFQDSLFAVII